MTVREIALLLPGQGSQHVGMAWDLYGVEPVFADAVDEFLALLGDGALVRRRWLSGSPDLDDGRIAQPLLFAVGYAFGVMVLRSNLRIVALLGHSIGELAAATLAGVFDLVAAARIVDARSRAMDRAPAGGMSVVSATPGQVRSRLSPQWRRAGVCVAAVNAPRRTMLAGPEVELAAVESALRAGGFTVRRIGARQPWHSPGMTAVAAELEAAVAAEVPAVPSIPLWSGRTGRRVRAREAVRPEFWAGQVAVPVLFWHALSDLLMSTDAVLTDTGPGAGLAVHARTHPAVRAGRRRVVGSAEVLAAVRDPRSARNLQAHSGKRSDEMSEQPTPVGVWTGTATHDGRADPFTIAFGLDGTVVLTTPVSAGTGKWSADGGHRFGYRIREDLDSSDLPFSHVDIEVVAELNDTTYSGTGTAEIYGRDGTVQQFTTDAVVAARRVD
ncbi:acyl transferase family protein [Nocardia tenerifensis]|uniref:Acyl transferase family protein n=1 Tax=Nocardia tenerifensis TaxID=228006 RepID=A0A318KD01_9NOCA|nr:acyltransferase domain-containing protein [Nocardia tenerifensis]PXX71717.1 acyl transferase family protein [Nocardia tenerifensis]